MTASSWKGRDLVAETAGRFRRDKIVVVRQQIRRMRRTMLARHRFVRTPEASARIARRLVAPQ